MKTLFFITALCSSTICMAQTPQEVDWKWYQLALKHWDTAYCGRISYFSPDLETLCRAKLTRNLSACAKIKSPALREECERRDYGPMFP